MTSRAATLLLLAVAFFLFFFRLSDRALWSSDEGRYAEIPREMLERQDFVSPHLNHVCYFEKPPLAYWLTAGALALAGPGEAAARFWPALLGALGVLAVWFFARRWFGSGAAWWSAFFLLTAIGYFLVGRYLVLDMPFTFFLTLGLLCFLEGFEARDKRFLAAAYAAFGLATLVKGIVALVFPGMIAFLYLFWTRQWPRWRDTGVLWGPLLTAAVALPWFIVISTRNPTFFEFFFVHEHLQRFLTHSAGRKGPFYYFFGIGMLFFLPWSLFVFFSGKGLCSRKPPASPENKKRAFLLLSAVFIFLFFTMSRSKLPPYILPMLPPLALLMGYWTQQLLSGKLQEPKVLKAIPVIFLCCFVVMAAGAVALTVFLALTDMPEKPYLESYIYAAAALFVAGSGLAALWSRRQKTLRRAFISWGAAIVLAYLVVLLGMEALDPLQSSKEIALLLNRHMRPQDKLAIAGGFEDFSDLPFYTHRRIVIVGTNIGELSYGSKLGDQSAWFVSLDAFRDMLRQADAQGQDVYCVAQENEYNELLDKGMQALQVLTVTPKAYVLVHRSGRER